MIVRKLEVDLYSIQNSVFSDFVANTGGALSVNHSEVCFESISSSYFSCKATGYDYYSREKISGGAIAFYGKTSRYEKNCFEACQAPGIGTALFDICEKENNFHLLNTYHKNFDGDGVLTIDSVCPVTIKDNNISQSSTLRNPAISVSLPASGEICRNNFVNLISTDKYYYVWTYYDTTFRECNFVQFGETKVSVFMISDKSVTIQDCVLWDIPDVLAESGHSFTALDSASNAPKYIGVALINTITVTSDLKTHQISGEFLCNMKTHKCVKNFPGFAVLALMTLLK